MITETTFPDIEPRDYLYCDTCGEVFDCWKYESLAETGHDGHSIRRLTRGEFEASTHESADTMCDYF